VNLIGDNIDTIKKNKEIVTDASKEVGLEINVEETKRMLLSRHQNVGHVAISSPECRSNSGHKNSKQII
jgi:hypothetical protein